MNLVRGRPASMARNEQSAEAKIGGQGMGWLSGTSQSACGRSNLFSTDSKLPPDRGNGLAVQHLDCPSEDNVLLH